MFAFVGIFLFVATGVAALLYSIKKQENDKASALDLQIQSAVVSAAYMGFNLGKLGGTSTDIDMLLFQVRSGNPMALAQWLSNKFGTNLPPITLPNYRAPEGMTARKN